jgi:hypothetical protein
LQFNAAGTVNYNTRGKQFVLVCTKMTGSSQFLHFYSTWKGSNSSSFLSFYFLLSFFKGAKFYLILINVDFLLRSWLKVFLGRKSRGAAVSRNWRPLLAKKLRRRMSRFYCIVPFPDLNFYFFFLIIGQIFWRIWVLLATLQHF